MLTHDDTGFVAAKSKPITLEEDASNLELFDHHLSSLKRHRLILTDGHTVFVFDTKTGRLIAKRQVTNHFKLVIVETDGEYIVASNSEKLFFWHISNLGTDRKTSGSSFFRQNEINYYWHY